MKKFHLLKILAGYENEIEHCYLALRYSFTLRISLVCVSKVVSNR